MTCMIDKWHDRYHGEEPDYVNCPYCADELMVDELPTLEEMASMGGDADAFPMLSVEAGGEVERGDWSELTSDPDDNPWGL